MIRSLKRLVGLGIFSVFAAAVAFGFYYNPTRTKLVGTWDVTIEMTSTDLQQMGVRQNPLVNTANRLLNTARMQLELHDDESMRFGRTVFGQWLGATGTWQLKKSRGDRVIVTGQFVDEPEPREWLIEFVDENTFQMVPPPDSYFPVSKLITFRRASTGVES